VLHQTYRSKGILAFLAHAPQAASLAPPKQLAANLTAKISHPLISIEGRKDHKRSEDGFPFEMIRPMIYLPAAVAFLLKRHF
jgi:hypothetical protein